MPSVMALNATHSFEIQPSEFAMNLVTVAGATFAGIGICGLCCCALCTAWWTFAYAYFIEKKTTHLARILHESKALPRAPLCGNSTVPALEVCFSNTEEPAHRRISAEALLWLLQTPVVAMLALCASKFTDYHQVPKGILLLYPLLALRNKAVIAELEGCSVFDLFRNNPLTFMTSAPASFSGASHAVFIVAMLLGENNHIHQRAHVAWAASVVPAPFLWLFDKLGFAGLAALLLAIPLYWQTMMVLSSIDGRGGNPWAGNPYLVAKMIGMSRVARKEENPSQESKMIYAMYTAFLLWLQGGIESGLTLFVQSSYLMAKGETLGKNMVDTVSILVSTFLLFKSVSRATYEGRVLCDKKDPQVFLIYFAFLLPIWLLTFIMLARIYGIVSCPSFEWGVFTGCVPLCSNVTSATKKLCVPK